MVINLIEVLKECFKNYFFEPEYENSFLLEKLRKGSLKPFSIVTLSRGWKTRSRRVWFALWDVADML